MAEASLLHVVGSLLGKFGPYAFQDIKSSWRANKDLLKLRVTIETIKDGLLDAENRQDTRKPQSNLVIKRLRRLKNILYEADDLFDEVITIKAVRETLTGKEKVVEVLHSLFSKSNPAVLQVRIAGKIKKIRRELDDILKDMEFFKHDPHSGVQTVSCQAIYGRETVSIPAEEVIGRVEDVSIILPLLLNPESKEEDFPDVISIIGIGGLGKTSLAQLLYNNEDVKENFELRAWACISDIVETKQKAIIVSKAFQLGGEGSIDSSTLEELRLEIGKMITNQRYLLVLDDFWDEDPHRWRDLRVLLRGGKRGSKIVVTTRSSIVAHAMDADSHDLKGLPDDKAEELFERWAFRSTASAENKDMLMKIGRVIVQKCKNVPLAIKAVASLLNSYPGNEAKWKSVSESELLALDGDKNQNMKIVPVLKLSYDHLPSHLKPCFVFCSIYPKDCWIPHDELVVYWIAQGYVEHCSDRGHTGLLEKGGDYVRELTSRSFLQHRTTDQGIDEYCMHDLMHDLAQEVAGEELLAVNKDNFDDSKLKIKEERIRHLSFRGVQIDDDLLFSHKGKYVRSCICFGSLGENHPFTKGAIWKKFSYLRLLVMRDMGLEWLPSSVCELKHLRCLIISWNDKLTHLPNEITKLHNLKILNVCCCWNLESLPNNLNRLINLTSLVLGGCNSLTSMPYKFGELTSLECLDRFIVGENSTNCSGLEAIAGLVNLRGKLSVEFNKWSGDVVRKENTLDLSSLVHLDELTFQWSFDNASEWESEGFEFECSQLPSNLKALRVDHFPGRKLPEWEKSFNNLLDVRLFMCLNCRYLPSFGRHPRLTVLELNTLTELEYIEVEEDDEFVAETHFPCLRKLTLTYLPSLKAWSRGMEKLGVKFQLQQMSSSPADVAAFPRFHSLAHLDIDACPELTSMPLPLNGTALINLNWQRLKEPLLTLLCAEEGVQRNPLALGRTSI